MCVLYIASVHVYVCAFVFISTDKCCIAGVSSSHAYACMCTVNMLYILVCVSTGGDVGGSQVTPSEALFLS